MDGAANHAADTGSTGGNNAANTETPGLEDVQRIADRIHPKVKEGTITEEYRSYDVITHFYDGDLTEEEWETIRRAVTAEDLLTYKIIVGGRYREPGEEYFGRYGYMYRGYEIVAAERPAPGVEPETEYGMRFIAQQLPDGIGETAADQLVDRERNHELFDVYGFDPLEPGPVTVDDEAPRYHDSLIDWAEQV